MLLNSLTGNTSKRNELNCVNCNKAVVGCNGSQE